MRSKCDCAHRRVKKNPPDAEIAPRRTDFFVYAERNSGERGTRVRRCAEGDCGRRRHQKRTPFTKTNAGSIEAVRLVEVRRHRVAKCHRGVGPAVRCQWENRQSWPGSHVFLVGKKCDLGTPRSDKLPNLDIGTSTSTASTPPACTAMRSIALRCAGGEVARLQASSTAVQYVSMTLRCRRAAASRSLRMVLCDVASATRRGTRNTWRMLA